MVSTRLCPRCNTKNSKNAETCYNCQTPLKVSKKSDKKYAVSNKKQGDKPSKKPLLSYFNKESLELKIIAIGTAIFIISNIILLEFAPDYSVLISGFATLLFTYLAFKKYRNYEDLRSLEVKVLINYLIMALIGMLVLILLIFSKIID